MLKLRQAIETKVSQFNEAIKSAKSENVALELLRDKKRFLCQNDLFYLCCLTQNYEIAKPKVYYFEGIDGIHKALEQVLEEADEYVGYGSVVGYHIWLWIK